MYTALFSSSRLSSRRSVDIPKELRLVLRSDPRTGSGRGNRKPGRVRRRRVESCRRTEGISDDPEYPQGDRYRVRANAGGRGRSSLTSSIPVILASQNQWKGLSLRAILANETKRCPLRFFRADRQQRIDAGVSADDIRWHITELIWERAWIPRDEQAALFDGKG